MNNKVKNLIDKLEHTNSLSILDYQYLIENQSQNASDYINTKAQSISNKFFHNHIYIRGLIEVSNICHNNCYYCGIRKSNTNCQRYMLTKEQILNCCSLGYKLGFRTFVLQGGEGKTSQCEFITALVREIKNRHQDCAITLSLGEYSKQEYQQMFDAGADRYLLRHETANKDHYEKLHPLDMSFENRIECLNNLKEIGFQVGCGFMVGSPYQTSKNLAEDLKFIEKFKPDMCGIGPFIPHKDTVFAKDNPGTLGDTLFLLSIIRLIHPTILLPSTTALGTIDQFGREKGILAGANVVMPNLSPVSIRSKYSLYDNKLSTGAESAQNLNILKNRFKKIGYDIVISKGDAIK
ncbi:MAG: [FeFe] hydrogenase H-cluster radical SAM maturase HydE [Anaerovoracaceae bacterium]